jgi:hypothetical protein
MKILPRGAIFENQYFGRWPLAGEAAPAADIRLDAILWDARMRVIRCRKNVKRR